ncbi:MAG TPA: CHRD domain-containing protein [Terriglobales bacterium]|nr:CHRD domain-containing protein [Terriglobales bacterium]
MRKLATLLIGVLLLGFALPAFAEHKDGRFRATLTSFEEVPTLSTPGRGEFLAQIEPDDSAIHYVLSYSGLAGTVSVAHIHLGRRATVGGVIAFLCGGGGKPACPPSGTVQGTIRASDVVGPTEQGIQPGEFAELLRAMRVRATYANVHTDLFPAGEIRGQIRFDWRAFFEK